MAPNAGSVSTPRPEVDRSLLRRRALEEQLTEVEHALKVCGAVGGGVRRGEETGRFEASRTRFSGRSGETEKHRVMKT